MQKESINTAPSCTDITDQTSLRLDEALQRMLSDAEQVSGFERISIQEADQRVLDELLISPINVPSHTNSAVDGFSLNSSDLPADGQIKELPVKGMIVAGRPHETPLESGTCLRIMTGAQMPENGDTVVMQEHVELNDNTIRIDDRHKAGQNVRQAGEDLAKGSTVLKPGKFLTAADIGLIASLGIGEINVKRRPRITIFSTGDEIHSIGQYLAEGGIYDSNRYTLSAALRRLNISLVDMGIVPDNREILLEAFSSASKNSDVIITSGGVSVGEADYTKEVLSSLGSVEFWKVAIKPGRPVAFGKINNATFFGLPGNPVAVMVTFYLLALPTIKKIMGINEETPQITVKARSAERLRKLPGRTEVVRGVLTQNSSGEWEARSTGKQGSGILKSMSDANAFLLLEHDRETVLPGELVTALPFAGLI